MVNLLSYSFMSYFRNEKKKRDFKKTLWVKGGVIETKQTEIT